MQIGLFFVYRCCFPLVDYQKTKCIYYILRLFHNTTSSKYFAILINYKTLIINVNLKMIG